MRNFIGRVHDARDFDASPQEVFYELVEVNRLLMIVDRTTGMVRRLPNIVAILRPNVRSGR